MNRKRALNGATQNIYHPYKFVDYIEAVGEVWIDLPNSEATAQGTIHAYLDLKNMGNADSICLFHTAKNVYWVGMDSADNGVSTSTKTNLSGTFNSGKKQNIFLYSYGGTRLSITDALQSGYNMQNGVGKCIQLKNCCLYKAMLGSISSNNVGNARAKWLDGTTRTMELVPCIRKADGVVGLLDVVSETFYTQTDGDGYLVAKMESDYNHKIPDTYQEVEFIEGTGTQYIRTFIYPDANTGIYVKFKSINYGRPITDSKVQVLLYPPSPSSDTQVFWRYLGITNQTVTIPFDINAVNESYLNFLNDRKAVFNDTILNSNLPTHTSVDNSYGIVVFANSYGNYSAVNVSTSRIYRIKISQDTALIRDYIPCYRVFDRKAGFYDIVDNNFYCSDGPVDTNFVYGPVRSSKTEIPPDNQIWYTSTDGTAVPISVAATVKWGTASVVSNTYENGKGVITFDSTVTATPANAFRRTDNTGKILTITFPDSLTTINYNSLIGHLSLKEIHGRNITTFAREYRIFPDSIILDYIDVESFTTHAALAFNKPTIKHDLYFKNLETIDGRTYGESQPTYNQLGCNAVRFDKLSNAYPYLKLDKVRNLVWSPNLTNIGDKFGYRWKAAGSYMVFRNPVPPTIAGQFFPSGTKPTFLVPMEGVEAYTAVTQFGANTAGYFEATVLPADNTSGDYCWLNDWSMWKWETDKWVQII